VRVYLPTTLPALGELRERGRLPATEAYAVTPDLRAAEGSEDPEELEYAAFTRAAQAALALLRADPAAPRRRVVVSADVSAAGPANGDRVRLAEPVELAAVAAVHVDTAGAEPEVAIAVVAGTEVDHELAWYDVSELAQLT
jgi:hypothetical protein